MISLVMMAVSVLSLQAQQATARLDSSVHQIGEWITLDLSLVAPSNAQVIWPAIGENVEELEVLDRSAIDTFSNGNKKTYKQTLTLTVFDSGFYAVPAFDFLVNGDSVSTTPMLLKVESIQIDTATADIKPIKDVMRAPVTFRELVPYILGGVALLAIIILTLLYLKNRKRKPVDIKEPEITIPPHEWAMEELKKLKQAGLWEKGEVKEYYVRLTDIFRQYIELRFRQPAMESTSDEIMDRMRLIPEAASIKGEIRSLLILSDLVKFAKANPLSNEHEQSMETVTEFVKLTTRKEAENPGEA